MNSKQLATLWAGIFAIGALTFFVPFALVPTPRAIFESQFGALTPTVRYGFVLAPPTEAMTIDWARVFTGMIFVFALTLGGLFTLGERRRSM